MLDPKEGEAATQQANQFTLPLGESLGEDAAELSPEGIAAEMKRFRGFIEGFALHQQRCQACFRPGEAEEALDQVAGGGLLGFWVRDEDADSRPLRPRREGSGQGRNENLKWPTA